MTINDYYKSDLIQLYQLMLAGTKVKLYTFKDGSIEVSFNSDYLILVPSNFWWIE